MGPADNASRAATDNVRWVIGYNSAATLCYRRVGGAVETETEMHFFHFHGFHGGGAWAIVAVGVIAIVAAVWYLIGRQSAGKSPPDPK